MKKLQKIKLIIACLIVLCSNLQLSGQSKNEEDFRKYFIGSSLFSVGNLFPDPPQFYQLNFGYWLSKKDAIVVEAITWKYGYPLGIPYGPDFDSPEEAYPGYIRGFGLGIDYQRFHWKKLYSTVHVTPFLQNFYDSDKNKIQNGFQLFLQLRLGYHFDLFKDRFYIEPSITFNYWPVNTNFPDSFAEIESDWPNYFLFEPGLNFGIKF